MKTKIRIRSNIFTHIFILYLSYYICIVSFDIIFSINTFIFIISYLIISYVEKKISRKIRRPNEDKVICIILKMINLNFLIANDLFVKK